eukprot:tig00020572_g11530.t1
MGIAALRHFGRAALCLSDVPEDAVWRSFRYGPSPSYEFSHLVPIAFAPLLCLRSSARVARPPERVREAANCGAEVVAVGDAPAAAALLRAGLRRLTPRADAGPQWVDAEGYAGARSRTGTPSRVRAVRGEEGERLAAACIADDPMLTNAH